MGPEYDIGPPGPPMPGDFPGDNDGYQNSSGRRTPDSGHRIRPTVSGSSGSAPPQANWDSDSRKSGERNRSRQRGGRTASGQMRICKKCGESLTGQFVRALDGTFHLDCFKCRVWALPLLPLILPSDLS
jgi:hypothetical protein